MAELEDKPRDGHRLHPGPDHAHRLTGEEQPVIAHSQRREHALTITAATTRRIRLSAAQFSSSPRSLGVSRNRAILLTAETERTTEPEGGGGRMSELAIAIRSQT